MKRKMVNLLILGLLLATGSVLAQSGGGYDVEWNVIGSAGGEFVTGGDYQLGFTLAQDTPPLVSAGGDYQIAQGYWSGRSFIPTAVTVNGLRVEARGDTLVVTWETASEVDLLGFHVYRSDSGEPDTFSQLNEGLIPSQSPGSPIGADYEWADATVEEGQSYFYLLEAMDIQGGATKHGPVSAVLQITTLYRSYLPIVSR